MTVLLSIPNVTAVQIVGKTRVPLTTNTLRISLPSPPAASTSPTATEAKLLLSIPPLTIPLTPTSLAGSKPPSIYLVTTPLPASSSSKPQQTGFIELAIPPASPHLLRFEEILVEHGFLEEGLATGADGVAAATRSAAVTGADRISGAMEKRDRVEPDQETRFPEVTKRTVGNGGEVTGKATRVTRRVGEAVSGAASKAGEWTGEKAGGMLPAFTTSATEDLDGGLPKEAVSRRIDAVGLAVGGTGESESHVTSIHAASASDIANQERRAEAEDLDAS